MTTLLFVCAAGGALVLLAGLAAWYWLRAPAASMRRDGTQAMTVRIRDRYVPASFLASAGVPLDLSFLREESDACSDEVFLPDFAIARHLPVGRAVTIQVRPEAPGDYLVTCRYGRYIGVIRVRSPREFAVRSRLRALLGRAGRLFQPSDAA